MGLDSRLKRRDQLRHCVAQIGTAAPRILAAAVPAGPYQALLVQAVCGDHQALESGGRWSRIVLAACWDAGKPDEVPERACVGFECLMAAADLLDEIQDGDPSPIAVAHGFGVATNVAAGLLILGADLVRGSGPVGNSWQDDASAGAGRAMTVGLLAAAAGQHLDLMGGAVCEITPEQLQVVAAKSASLTRAAAEIGAIFGTRDPARIRELGRIGYLLGMVAQLRNDARELNTRLTDGKGTAGCTISVHPEALTAWALSETFRHKARAAANEASADWLGDLLKESSDGRTPYEDGEPASEAAQQVGLLAY